ncbi:coiled-coil-helix-coiled-coil-helix domain-containing protein 2-like isoform X2 [Limulus polyphemus]|uniref:Coiled-coil-helix-coiled-coil-helix domain-containing protein 2-like isoform X2 n=1 Tax=Limulus polyphemus TaxID=6850 RepID=A0ABM1SME8_LIMPO|nr:coiled-coil-helix-coiled-coil-helix domain-containing protein 2-like isoform X2 [Limulus polyphemus]XP_022244804.1 coiled-coil-helix-coiled-coil-helix domain-containing protein 2-like isoform X2 [Limulus polyphemus]
MPRRGRSPSPSSRSRGAPLNRAPAPPAQRASAPPAPRQYTQPANVPQQQVQTMPQTQPRQPGLLGQMATTAAGVAVGSAVGHTLGHAITGGFSDNSSEVPATTQEQQPIYQQQTPAQGQNQNAPCQFELKQFMECAENQHDLSLCEGFREVLRQCRFSQGVSM